MRIGSKVTFTPAAWIGYIQNRAMATYCAPSRVTGEIDYINKEHRWFRVRYPVFSEEMHEAFKF